MRKRIYISGPITLGNRNQSFARACDAQKDLMLTGFAPFNPILSMVAPFAWDGDVPHDVWLAADLPWVAVADAVLRLPGESAGADEECAYAEKLGIPVYHEMVDLLLSELTDCEEAA